MPDHSRPRFVEGLPRHPITVEAVTALGHAATDGIHGTMPIESEFNDIVTEFLLYLDERICALVFDPERERWVVLENRPFDDASFPDVEVDRSTVTEFPLERVGSQILSIDIDISEAPPARWPVGPHRKMRWDVSRSCGASRW